MISIPPAEPLRFKVATYRRPLTVPAAIGAKTILLPVSVAYKNGVISTFSSNTADSENASVKIKFFTANSRFKTIKAAIRSGMLTRSER